VPVHFEVWEGFLNLQENRSLDDELKMFNAHSVLNADCAKVGGRAFGSRR